MAACLVWPACCCVDDVLSVGRRTVATVALTRWHHYVLPLQHVDGCRKPYRTQHSNHELPCQCYRYRCHCICCDVKRVRVCGRRCGSDVLDDDRAATVACCSENFSLTFSHARILTTGTLVTLTAARLTHVHIAFVDCVVDIDNAAGGGSANGLWLANITAAGNSGGAGGVYNSSIEIRRSVVRISAAAAAPANMGAVSIRGTMLENVSVRFHDNALTATWMGVLSPLFSGPESVAQVVLLRGGGRDGTNNVVVTVRNSSATLAASAGVFLVSVVGGAAFGGATIVVDRCLINLTARGPRTPLEANGIGAGLKREAAAVACESCNGVSIVLRTTNTTIRLFFNPANVARQSILSDGMIGSAVRVLVFVGSTVLLEDCHVLFELPADAGQPMGLVAILGLSLVSVLPGSTAPEDPTLLNVGIAIANTTMAVDFAQEVPAAESGALCAYARTMVVQQDITLATSVVGVALCVAHVIGSAHSTNVSIVISGSSSLHVAAFPTFERCSTNPNAVASYRSTITLRVLLPAANYSIVGLVWFGALDGVLANIVRTMLVDPLLRFYLPQLPPPMSVLLTNVSIDIHPGGGSAGWSPILLGPVARLVQQSMANGGTLLGAVLAMSHARIGTAQPQQAGSNTNTPTTITIGAYCPTEQPLLAVALIAVDIDAPISNGGVRMVVDVAGAGGDASCGQQQQGGAGTGITAAAVAYLDRVASIGPPSCVFLEGMQRPPTCAANASEQPLAATIVLRQIPALLQRTAYALVVVNNVSASIDWALSNLSMMMGASMPTVFAPPPPSSVRVLPLLFAWAARTTVAIDCVALNDADVSLDNVYPRSSAINFNVSWLQHLLEIRQCPSKTRHHSMTKTASRSVTLPGVAYDPSAALDQSEAIASLAFPITAMVVSCLVPELLPAALALQRGITIDRIGKTKDARSSASPASNIEVATLPFLENPFRIDFPGPDGHTAGALISLALAWVVWCSGAAAAPVLVSRTRIPVSSSTAVFAWCWLIPSIVLVLPWTAVSVYALQADSIVVGVVGCCVAGAVMIGVGARLLRLSLAHLPFRYVPQRHLHAQSCTHRLRCAAVAPAFVLEPVPTNVGRNCGGWWMRSLMRCCNPNVHLKVYALHMLMTMLTGVMFGFAYVPQSAAQHNPLLWGMVAVALVHISIVVWLRPYATLASTACAFALEAANIAGAVCVALSDTAATHCHAVPMVEGATLLAVGCLLAVLSNDVCFPPDPPRQGDLDTSMYSCFLPENTPSSQIPQHDWDGIKRLLYARMLPPPTDAPPDSPTASTAEALEQLVRLACFAIATPHATRDADGQEPSLPSTVGLDNQVRREN